MVIRRVTPDRDLTFGDLSVDLRMPPTGVFQPTDVELAPVLLLNAYRLFRSELSDSTGR
jgi:hypothetical protein